MSTLPSISGLNAVTHYQPTTNPLAVTHEQPRPRASNVFNLHPPRRSSPQTIVQGRLFMHAPLEPLLVPPAPGTPFRAQPLWIPQHLVSEIQPTAVIPDEIPKETGTKVLYRMLSKKSLREIAVERDVNLDATTCEEYVDQLVMYDTIMPEWSQKIFHATIDNLPALSKCQLWGFIRYHSLFTWPDYMTLAQDELVVHVCSIMLMGRFIVRIINDTDKERLQKILSKAPRKIVARIANDRRDIMHAGTTQKFVRKFSRQMMIQYICGDSDHEILPLWNRYHTIDKHKYRVSLRDLYEFSDAAFETFTPRWLVPSIVESILDALAQDTALLDTMMTNYQMLSPPDNDPIDYFLDNIIHYETVFTRPADTVTLSLEQVITLDREGREEYLKILTDVQLRTLCDAQLSYHNHREFIHRCLEFFDHPTFFVPYEMLRAVNSETVVNFDDIRTPGLMTVAYGTAIHYYVYDLQDLISAFNIGSAVADVKFYQPQDPTLVFEYREIEVLDRLLTKYHGQQVDELRGIIEKVLVCSRERRITDQIHIDKFNMFNIDERAMIKRILILIFETGMYMRRWKGPGHPYPIFRKDTESPELPDNVVMVWLTSIRDHLDSTTTRVQKFILELPQCERRQRDITVYDMSFKKLWDRVIAGDASDIGYCIRMASSFFVGTALHYHRVFLDEDIPGTAGDFDVIS